MPLSIHCCNAVSSGLLLSSAFACFVRVLFVLLLNMNADSEDDDAFDAINAAFMGGRGSAGTGTSSRRHVMFSVCAFNACVSACSVDPITRSSRF